MRVVGRELGDVAWVTGERRRHPSGARSDETRKLITTNRRCS
jgi:hypothetical protein